MRIMFFTILISFSITTSAKFAPWVVEIPCSSLKIEVQKCESFQTNNHKLIRNPNQKKLQLVGSRIEALVLEETPIKCLGQKKIDLKRYSKKFQSLNQSSTFIVRNQSCPDLEQNKVAFVRTVKLLCDTPNAMMIEDCFLGAIQQKEKSLIVDLLKK